LIVVPSVLPVSIDWPTLEAMIFSGKCLVLFTESRAAEREVWENNMYHFISQTGFASVTMDDFEKQCVLARPPFSRTLILFNHFTVLGAIGMNGASTGFLSNVFKLRFFANVNRSPFFIKQIISCARKLQSFPSFVAVDFWESSNVFQVVDLINSKFYFHDGTWDSAEATQVATTLGIA